MALKKALDANKKTYPALCDIYQENDEVILRMEMPGVSKDNLDIKVDNDLLVINGKKVIKHPKGDFKLHEIRENDYYHQFTLDETIDRNKINAEIKNGVLTLALGVKESEKPRKIEVLAK